MDRRTASEIEKREGVRERVRHAQAAGCEDTHKKKRRGLDRTRTGQCSSTGRQSDVASWSPRATAASTGKRDRGIQSRRRTNAHEKQEPHHSIGRRDQSRWKGKGPQAILSYSPSAATLSILHKEQEKKERVMKREAKKEREKAQRFDIVGPHLPSCSTILSLRPPNPTITRRTRSSAL